MKPIPGERTTRGSEDRWRREIIAMRNGIDPISQLQSGGPQCIILECLAIAPPCDDFRCNPVTVGAPRSIRNEDISSASRQNLARQLAQPAAIRRRPTPWPRQTSQLRWILRFPTCWVGWSADAARLRRVCRICPLRRRPFGRCETASQHLSRKIEALPKSRQSSTKSTSTRLKIEWRPGQTIPTRRLQQVRAVKRSPPSQAAAAGNATSNSAGLVA